MVPISNARQSNFFQYLLGVLQHLVVPETEHGQTLLRQKRGAAQVVFGLLRMGWGERSEGSGQAQRGVMSEAYIPSWSRLHSGTCHDMAVADFAACQGGVTHSRCIPFAAAAEAAGR